jgi:hypothetical protein
VRLLPLDLVTGAMPLKVLTASALAKRARSLANAVSSRGAIADCSGEPLRSNQAILISLFKNDFFELYRVYLPAFERALKRCQQGKKRSEIRIRIPASFSQRW